MRVLAIGDPHLSSAKPKPMSVFGESWQGHPEAFFEGWRSVVRDDDLVLVPGDISWALQFDDALMDLEKLAELPGEKVLLRGNHDYWWPSIGRLRSALPPTMHAIQNDALRLGSVVVAGTRGWICPGTHEFTEQDDRIYRRELERLDLSLEKARDLKQPGDASVVMLHFPPTNARLEASGFTDRITRFAPDALVFGHIHGGEGPFAPELPGTRVVFAAADALRFRPALVLEQA